MSEFGSIKIFYTFQLALKQIKIDKKNSAQIIMFKIKIKLQPALQRQYRFLYLGERIIFKSICYSMLVEIK